MYNKQTYKIMGFMNAKVIGNKEDVNKANSIANKISGVVITVFLIALVLAVTGVITF